VFVDTNVLVCPFPPVDALRALADLAVFPVVAVHAALVRRAATRSAAGPVPYWDALIPEAAVEAGAGTVYSEDLQPGEACGGVTVHDPLAAGIAGA
jgi:predicted nucleic acid-binding protein